MSQAILLVLVLLVVVGSVSQSVVMWDERLVPVGRVHQARNPKRNQERWARRWRYWQHQHPSVSRARRRRRRLHLMQQLLKPIPSGTVPAAGLGQVKRLPDQPPVEPEPPDPLADLRQQRGWIDRMSERDLWALLVRVRWPHGPACPCCQEHDPRYVELIDPDYRDGLGRWRCQVCAAAGDAGEGGTFTPLTDTLLEGSRLEAPTLWLLVELFADSQASVEAATEAQVNRHTADRLFRLLRAAIYHTRSQEPLVLTPEQVTEFDEVYLTAGLKGQAGGLELDRPARKRGLKRPGRGTRDSDRLPVFGLLCRGGQVRLFVLRNVQTDTIRPLVHQGARVYTDSYSIYHFLSREGYRHQVVNHSAGEYARDLDGDGRCEVHCNTLECTWSWLRPMLRTYRGVSKVYLPLYVAQFEFMFNRRHHNHWNRTLDVLQAVFQVEPSQVAGLLASVQTAEFAQVCPVAG
ncbi:MAG: IS1595 family transposase [Chloroflexota bacterium]